MILVCILILDIMSRAIIIMLAIRIVFGVLTEPTCTRLIRKCVEESMQSKSWENKNKTRISELCSELKTYHGDNLSEIQSLQYRYLMHELCDRLGISRRHLSVMLVDVIDTVAKMRPYRPRSDVKFNYSGPKITVDGISVDLNYVLLHNLGNCVTRAAVRDELKRAMTPTSLIDTRSILTTYPVLRLWAWDRWFIKSDIRSIGSEDSPCIW